MKDLTIYCMSINPANLNTIKSLNYIPVGLYSDNFSDEWMRDNTGDNISKKNPYMAGVPIHSIDKYIGTLGKDRRFLSRVNIPPAYIDNIDELPIPNRKYIRHIRYHNILGVTDNLATLISSRGCPYLCTFCNSPLYTPIKLNGYFYCSNKCAHIKEPRRGRANSCRLSYALHPCLVQMIVA